MILGIQILSITGLERNDTYLCTKINGKISRVFYIKLTKNNTQITLIFGPNNMYVKIRMHHRQRLNKHIHSCVYILLIHN